MDEKGFLMGCLLKVKRIFSLTESEGKKFKELLRVG
jgi:hypothetical protein